METGKHWAELYYSIAACLQETRDHVSRDMKKLFPAVQDFYIEDK